MTDPQKPSTLGSHQSSTVKQDSSESEAATTEIAPTIYELLYTEWNATAILNSREIPFFKILDISIPDPLKPLVVIQYDRHQQIQELAVMATEFYVLHYQRRLDRAMEYTVKSIHDAQWIVQSQSDAAKQPHFVTRHERGLNCSCKDYVNQNEALREHWWLWQFISQQAQCKHIQAFMEEIQVPRYSIDPAAPPKSYGVPTLEAL
jgi:hypothetical protein